MMGRMDHFITKISRKWFGLEWSMRPPREIDRLRFERMLITLRWTINDEITDRLR